MDVHPWIGKSTAEVLNLNGPAKLLENISSVFQLS